jgi:hypothetical protein
MASGRLAPVHRDSCGGEIISGKQEQELGHLDGRANQYDVLSWGGAFGIESRAKAEWIVRQQGGTVKLTAGTPKAGTKTVEIALG